MAEKYIAPKAEVVKFDSMDVICTSGCETAYVGYGSKKGQQWVWVDDRTYYISH